MFFVIYGTGAAIWWSWELSSWREYEGRMTCGLFFIASLFSAVFWPVSSLTELFAYLRYRNDTP